MINKRKRVPQSDLNIYYTPPRPDAAFQYELEQQIERSKQRKFSAENRLNGIQRWADSIDPIEECEATQGPLQEPEVTFSLSDTQQKQDPFQQIMAMQGGQKEQPEEGEEITSFLFEDVLQTQQSNIQSNISSFTEEEPPEDIDNYSATDNGAGLIQTQVEEFDDETDKQSVEQIDNNPEFSDNEELLPPPIIKPSIQLDFKLPQMIPVPSLSSLRHPKKKEKDKTMLELKGLAAYAFDIIAHETEAYTKWEADLNKKVASEGSLLKVCSDEKELETFMFRMLNPTIENGLVYASCVMLDNETLEGMIPSIKDSPSSLKTNGNDSLQDFTSIQQTSSLPTYTEKEDDIKILVAFSFVYTSVKMDEFVQNNTMVAICPPFDTRLVNGAEVNIVTRFRPGGN